MAKITEKWVAWLHRPFDSTLDVTVRRVQIPVVETPGQFKVSRDNPAARAIGHRSTINKSANNCLFDTEIEALENLLAQCSRKERNAESKLVEARRNLLAVHKALNDAVCVNSGVN